MWVAPELFHKQEGYDPFFADIYSVGLVFYFLSQGENPFSAGSDEEVKFLLMNGPLVSLMILTLIFKR
jgi:serine/threonine protein kinase